MDGITINHGILGLMPGTYGSKDIILHIIILVRTTTCRYYAMMHREHFFKYFIFMITLIYQSMFQLGLSDIFWSIMISEPLSLIV